MAKRIISTENAPKAIGPYSQAVAAGGFVFVSGQVSCDPKTGEIIAGDVAVQARQTLENLKAILEAAGSSLENVVKTTVYLKNMGDFAAMNAVYAEYFNKGQPARATVEVARLPRDVLVEIEAIAIA